MIFKIFSVYDSKVEVYSSPFFVPTKAAAIRSFNDIVNDSTSVYYAHPEDYTLFEIGSWNDATAEVDSLKTPVSLGVALEYKISV